MGTIRKSSDIADPGALTPAKFGTF